MEDNKKDEELELKVDQTGASLKIKNHHNRVLAQIGDCVIDALSYFRWNNAVKFLDKYVEKKRVRNLEGRETPLPPKFLIEILDNAFQEDKEIIQNEWDNLLLNWQDPDKNCDKKYIYIDLLKNLDINEIKLLKIISKDRNFEIILSNKNAYYDKNAIQQILNLTEEEYEIVMLNLFRLGICESLKSTGNVMSIGNLQVKADAGIDKIRITRLGYNLIKNCEE